MWLIPLISALIGATASVEVMIGIGHPASRAGFGVAILGLLAGLVAGLRLQLRTGGSIRESFAEWGRWVLLLAALGWVSGPVRTANQVGAGDAFWYTTTVGDFLAQIRAGVFPVWVGQSEYAFNGAVFPLRIAPGFQHAAGLLDVLTGATLSALQVKNLLLCCVCTCFAFNLYSATLAITRGAKRNLCAALAACGVISLGFLAPMYSGDQYMQTLAMSIAPCVMASWYLWIESPSSRASWRWGLCLAALCWAHSPMAAWLGGFSVLVFVWGVVARGFLKADFFRGLRIAAGAVTLGAYPIVSFLAVDNRIAAPSSVESLLGQIGLYFPEAFKPLTAANDTHTTYQIGLGIIGLLVFAAVATFRRRTPFGTLLVGLIALAATLMFPVPVLTRALWSAAPVTFVTLTNVWPQQRLVPTITLLVLALAARSAPSLRGRWIWGMAAVLTAALAWTGYQTSFVLARAHAIAVPAPAAARSLLTTNVVLTRYPYASFERAPAYFTHGYTDPRLENRLLKPGGSQILASNLEASAPDIRQGRLRNLVSEGAMQQVETESKKAFEFRPRLDLKGGKRYALRLTLPSDIEGTLVLAGPLLFRDYPLPDSGSGILRAGGAGAFGSLSTSSRVIPINTDNDENETLILSLFLSRETERFDIPYALYEVEPDSLPVRVQSLIPFRAEVTTGYAAWLETPRVWISGWKATVNGHTVATVRTSQDLVGIPLEAGHSEITLRYDPPVWLSLLYLVSIGGWGAAMALGVAGLVKDRHPGVGRG